MFRRARPELALIALVVSGLGSARGDVPRGRRTAHKPPTHVVLHTVDLDAQGTLARLAPGVAVAAGAGRGGPPALAHHRPPAGPRAGAAAGPPAPLPRGTPPPPPPRP